MSNRDLIERLLKTAPMPGCMAPDGAEPCVGYLDIMDASIAAAAALESHEWQDISTAPKDTAILLLSTGYAIGHFNTKDNRWWTNTDGTGTSEERLLNSWAPPTHWQPLPQPPGDKDDR